MFKKIANFFSVIFQPTPTLTLSPLFRQDIIPVNEIAVISGKMENEYQRDILFCTATLVGEARGEGHNGMHAVVNVALNRLYGSDSWWHREKGDGIPDDTLAAVCVDPYQFSCWNDGETRGKKKDPNYDLCVRLANPDNFAENLKNMYFTSALCLVIQALDNDLEDITYGAMHYHAVGIVPDWAKGKKPILVLNNHLFYNNIT